jgi:hypothetical protein
MTDPQEPIELLDKVRAHIPGSNMTVESTIKAKQVTPGIVFKAIVKRFPESDASMDGDRLVILYPDRSLKLGFLEFEFLRKFDIGIGDRSFWDNKVTFSVIPVGDAVTVKGEIAQRWSKRAAMFLMVPLFGWAVLFNVFVRTHILEKRRLRSKIQSILKDVAREVQRDQLTSSLS